MGFGFSLFKAIAFSKLYHFTGLGGIVTCAWLTVNKMIEIKNRIRYLFNKIIGILYGSTDILRHEITKSHLQLLINLYLIIR
jgi:hypothetical protein